MQSELALFHNISCRSRIRMLFTNCYPRMTEEKKVGKMQTVFLCSNEKVPHSQRSCEFKRDSTLWLRHFPRNLLVTRTFWLTIIILIQLDCFPRIQYNIRRNCVFRKSSTPNSLLVYQLRYIKGSFDLDVISFFFQSENQILMIILVLVDWIGLLVATVIVGDDPSLIPANMMRTHFRSSCS